ncbi:LOW QUALITY PROTEIN: hypothetical protein PHMEG_00038582, partial [Phytophthora megakarya]
MSKDMYVTIADENWDGVGAISGIDGKSTRMEEAFYIPGLDRRLLSVGKLAERGMSVEFQRNSCVIWDKSKAVASGKKIGKAYVLDCQQDVAYYTEYSGVDSEWELWHARMGHLNDDSLTKTRLATTGLPKTQRIIKTLCGGCMKGKQTVSHFPSRSFTATTRPLELVHTDVMGPMKTRSKEGARYVLVFVDDYSRYVVVYFLKKKSEVANNVLDHNQWGERIKCLRSDNGTEFVNKSMDKICQQYGIVHQKTVPYSPQQNGVAERMNRTIMEKARSMLLYKGVPTVWWAEAVSTAVYLINRTSTSTRPSTTPYEPSFKFGSVGYAHVDKSKRTKLEAKSFKCMFLGYAEDSKGYRVYDLESNKVKVSRSVKLDERQVNGIYDTTTAEDSTITYVTKDVEGSALPERTEQPAADEPMDSVGEEAIEDVEMQMEFESSPGQELT